MNRALTFCLGYFLLLLTTSCRTVAPDVTDLNSWDALHGGEWKVENHEALLGTNGKNWSTNPETSGSWLSTREQYKDFILELDFAIKGNSGIFFRSAREKNPAFTGYEVQILDDHGRAPAKFTTGSIYDLVAPSKNMSKPGGQWNSMRIEARGTHIQVTLNGEKVIDTHLSRASRGYIGIQNHDDQSEIRIKNFKVTPL
jgi:hypothetical protein